MSDVRAPSGSHRINRLSNPIPDDAVECQICFISLDDQSAEQRQQHYEIHFLQDIAEVELLSQPQPGASKKSHNVLKNILPVHGPKDSFWYPALSTQPPSNYTPGMVKLLRRALQRSQAGGHTRRGVLCYERAVYISREPWDASWGCGYRNFLMACAVLMDQQIQPLYFPLLDSPVPPSVRNVQQWIEDAWKEGFDQQGYEQLGKLINTRQWIGTSDLWTAFSYRGVPAELVDFRDGAQSLVNWVVAYFSLPSLSDVKDNVGSSKVTEVSLRSDGITITDRMPIILQHDGHSRTIVGYEVVKNGQINLLTFDPSKLPKTTLRQAAMSLASYQSDITEPSSMATSSSKPIHSPSKHSSPSKHRNILDFFHAKSHPKSHHKRKSSLKPMPGKQKHSRRDVQSASPVKNLHQAEMSKLGGKDVIDLSSDSDDSEVIVLETSDIPGAPRSKQSQKQPPDLWRDGLQPSQVLNFFRLELHRLEKKKQYQVLYFPMTAPLTEQERVMRKVVRSTRY